MMEQRSSGGNRSFDGFDPAAWPSPPRTPSRSAQWRRRSQGGANTSARQVQLQDADPRFQHTIDKVKKRQGAPTKRPKVQGSNFIVPKKSYNRLLKARANLEEHNARLRKQASDSRKRAEADRSRCG